MKRWKFVLLAAIVFGSSYFLDGVSSATAETVITLRVVDQSGLEHARATIWEASIGCVVTGTPVSLNDGSHTFTIQPAAEFGGASAPLLSPDDLDLKFLQITLWGGAGDTLTSYFAELVCRRW